MLPYQKPMATRAISGIPRCEEPRVQACVICRCALKHFENVYCKPCNEVIENRMHIRYGRV